MSVKEKRGLIKIIPKNLAIDHQRNQDFQKDNRRVHAALSRLETFDGAGHQVATLQSIIEKLWDVETTTTKLQHRRFFLHNHFTLSKNR